MTLRSMLAPFTGPPPKWPWALHYRLKGHSEYKTRIHLYPLVTWASLGGVTETSLALLWWSGYTLTPHRALFSSMTSSQMFSSTLTENSWSPSCKFLFRDGSKMSWLTPYFCPAGLIKKLKSCSLEEHLSAHLATVLNNQLHYLENETDSRYL